MNIVSLSGGKDSCATALIMQLLGIQIDHLVYVDVGTWEFPQVRAAAEKVSVLVGVPLTICHPVDFDWWMLERLVTKKDGTIMKGSGWPSRQHGRWCTREKLVAFDKTVRGLGPDVVRCVGYAADEEHRTKTKSLLTRIKKGQNFRYPLIEAGITEADALQYCYSKGIDWGGLYEVFRTKSGRTPRMSCWCCPHQPLESLRILRSEFPELWNRMIQMDKAASQRVFKGWDKDGTAVTVEDLDRRFEKEM